MDNKPSVEQSAELEVLFKEYSEKVSKILGHPYDVCALMHKMHTTENEPCTGTLVISDAHFDQTVVMLQQATMLVLRSAEQDFNTAGNVH
jgi:hypothetical protein